MINRTYYLEKLRKMRDVNLIKVLTGARRVGKSTLMLQEIEALKSDGIKKEHIYYLNLEGVENQKYLDDYVSLYDDILEALDVSQRCYVFLDEVGQVKGFEKLIDGLNVVENINLTITGSNAYLLSSDLATLFAGRYIELHILPFSFKEYKSFIGGEAPDNQLFMQYLEFGSLPETASLLKLGKGVVHKYIEGVYSSVLHKDVVVRNKLQNPLTLDNIAKFLFDSAGSPISANKIANTLSSAGMSISHPTAEKVLEAIEQAYIFYKVRRYDVHGKKLLNTGYKYYPVDTGLRNVALGREMNLDNGRLLETVVYFELLRRSQSVTIGKVGDTEIDFITINDDGFKEYYQVAWTTMGEQTLSRELSPLNKAHDNHYKYLLTMDDWTNVSYNGIRKINVLDWLLSD
jgi:predicted AAA+ superfamily ATPase